MPLFQKLEFLGSYNVSGDTLDQINIEVDELEPSRPTLGINVKRKMSTQKAGRYLKLSLTLSKLIH